MNPDTPIVPITLRQVLQIIAGSVAWVAFFVFMLTATYADQPADQAFYAAMMPLTMLYWGIAAVLIHWLTRPLYGGKGDTK